MQSTSPDQTVVPESERSAEPAPDTEAGGHGRGAWTTRPWYGRHRTWLKQQFAILLMNVVVAAVVVAAALLRLLDSGSTRVSPPELALKVFALWCLAFLPCWLYVRFLGQRAGALWEEYVLNLHRLGWDWPRFLPRPVETSHYFQEWSADGGRSEQAPEQNIYRKKFNAYYGRSVAENAAEENFRVRLDTLFPVVLTAAVLAVCWAAVLWDDGFLRAPSTFWDVLKFGFLGAYVFIVQMLLRRFFGSDLRPSAYTSALLRIIVVLVSGAALYQLLEIWLTGSGEARRWEAAVMFTIGFFPLVATQVLLRAVAAPLRFAMPSLKSDYPLSQLDGLNIWYEARLMEENIEDIQNLTTANLVDVILHTRAPVGRLVDWVDQAHLFLHLDRVEHGVKEARRARQPTPGTADPDAGKADSWTPVTPPGDATPSTDAQKLHRLVGTSVGPGSRGGTRTRTVLRQVGIRSATDLLKAFPPDQFDPLVADGNAAPQQQPIAQMLEDAGIDCGQLRLLVRVLSEEQGLAPVWNWNDRGVRARCPRRWPRSVRTCPISHADRAE